MTNRAPYSASPATAKEICRLWSAHLDSLDRHLSANMWALAAATVLLIAYPIVAIVIPDVVHGIVPDVVRTVLDLI